MIFYVTINPNVTIPRFIMPDVKDGGVMWLNKSTGMHFVRQDTTSSDADAKKKKKKGKAPKASEQIPAAAV